jgi:hypothetical protein
VIDWGSGAWFLSGPYGRFTTNSVSFSGGGPTSASFSFLAARRVVQVDAYNGGSVATIVTITCGSQPAVSRTIGPDQLMTIPTNWSAACTSVTFGSTNGWDTNFDNLVISTGSASTPTTTPTPTPAPSGMTLTFDDLPAPNRPLNGQYPSGVADWGTNVWYLSGPYGRFTTNSVSFNGAGPTTADVRFVSPRRVVRIDAYNGGSASSTISLTCSGQPTATTTLLARQLMTLSTNWTVGCTSVTIGSSNGWDTNFDNLVIE